MKEIKTVYITKEEDLSLLNKFFWTAFAFDTETESKKYLRTGMPSTDQEALRWMEQTLLGVSICDGKTCAYFDVILFPQAIDYLKENLKQTQLLFGHNIVFDAKALINAGIDVTEINWYDTMVAAHLIDENGEKSLKSLAKSILNEAETTTFLNARREGYSSLKFYRYAADDAAWTWRLAHYFMNRLQEENLTFLMNKIEMPYLKCVAEMEMNGMLVDRAKAEKIKTELQEEATTLEVKLYQIIGKPYSLQTTFPDMKVIIKSETNLNSPEAIRKILFQDLGLAATEKTSKGALSTGVKVLESLKGQHPFVDELLTYRVVQKLRSAFFEPLPQYIDSDGRIRSHYNVTGTRTGRLSSSKPNMQQLPKARKGFPNTRSCFIAPPGKKLIACDYSGQELRVLADLSQDPTMIDAFNKGKDLHLTTANQFFNLNIPEELLYDTHESYEETAERFSRERDKAKIVNFGIAYGKGAYGFAKDFKISEEDAQGILDKYFQNFPKVKEAIERCHRTLRYQGSVATKTGRKRRFKTNEQGYYAGAAYRESFNFLIQGFSADMLRLASINTRNLARDNSEWGLKLVATVHDENVYEVEEAYAKEAAKGIRKAFKEAVTLSLPLISKVKIGNHFGEIK